MKTTCAVVLSVSLTLGASAQSLTPTVASPDGGIQLKFSNAAKTADTPGGQLVYDVTFRGKPVIVHSALGMDFQGQASLGPKAAIASSTPVSKVDETYGIPVGKSNPVHNLYNAISIELREGSQSGERFSIEARAYNDGVAFRYVVPGAKPQTDLRIVNERTEFQLSKDATAYPLILRNYQTSWEDNYRTVPLTGIAPEQLIALPFLADVPGVAWVAITEADIDNYPGMYLQTTEQDRHILKARLSPHVGESGISVAAPTPLHSPWRTVMIADNPGRFIESTMVINLNPPSQIADTSWIKPGKAAWNWWSGSYAEGVNFKPGMNTATMEHYIDFASRSGLEYMMIDAGWAAHTIGENGSGADLTKSQPDIDLPEILSFARSKHVGVWLWAHWADIDRQFDEVFPLFEKWGIAGIKIDFLDRDDQWMVNFTRRVIEQAAAHHLMIDLHGAFKPDGFRRTYPNLMTTEGVLGLEYNKWSGRVTPDHNVMIAFTRMLAGPLDFTPGGFHNVTREAFEPRNLQPEVMGTRAHQTALFVVFESPFEMVSDYPEAYERQKELEFIRAVPTSWDETRVLNAKVGDYVTIARRRGRDWYIGSIAGWHGGDLDVPLNFLGPGQYTAEIYADASDAAENPTHTTPDRKPVNASMTLKAKLVSGGGQAIRIVPQ